MKIFYLTTIRSGLVLLLFQFLATAALANNILTDAEQNYLKKKQIITFVSQSHYAPFEFVQSDGTHTGMCIELARWIAAEFGFKTKFVATSFSAAQNMIRNGDADILTSFFYSQKRDQLFDFSQPIFHIPATIFVASDRPDIKGLNDLPGKKIAIQRGDYAEDFLKDKGVDFTVLHTDNFTTAADMVIRGKADAIIGDEQIVLYHLYSNNLTQKLKKVGKPLYVGDNSMAVSDGNRILIDILNKGIQHAKDSGILQSINKKWLGIQLNQKQSKLYQYRWSIGLIFFIVLSLLFTIWLWNVSLRREVRRRTKILSENEKFLDTVIEHIPNMVFVKKAEDLTFLRFNHAGERLTGYRQEELLGKTVYDWQPKEQADIFFKQDKEALNKVSLVDITEDTIQTRHQGERKLHTQKIPILDEQGRPKYLLGIAEDITDRLVSEQKLLTALKEKETLLKEVHHRVKNNMQVISSLLSLQVDTIEDSAILDIFNEINGRVHAMALVHENLYQTESFENLSATDYLHQLTAQLSSLMEGRQANIAYDINADDVIISMKDATPFGLIVTEIITNAIKYAFPERTSGTIKISLSRQKNGAFQLQISDNGIGFPAEFDPQKATSLGMQLILELTQNQLEGNCQVDGTHGVCWKITWT